MCASSDQKETMISIDSPHSFRWSIEWRELIEFEPSVVCRSDQRVSVYRQGNGRFLYPREYRRSNLIASSCISRRKSMLVLYYWSTRRETNVSFYSLFFLVLVNMSSRTMELYSSYSENIDKNNRLSSVEISLSLEFISSSCVVVNRLISNMLNRATTMRTSFCCDDHRAKEHNDAKDFGKTLLVIHISTAYNFVLSILLSHLCPCYFWLFCPNSFPYIFSWGCQLLGSRVPRDRLGLNTEIRLWIRRCFPSLCYFLSTW